MSAAGDMPCGGDVHHHWTEGDTRIGDDCCNCGYHNEPKSWANYQKRPDSGFGKCPGVSGYAFFLPVALEVAGERKIGPSSTGGTVTDVTLYPAGTDPRLGLEDVTEWWEFP